jgi:hypothetical protein
MICSACMQLTCLFPSIGTLIFCRHWFTWQTRMCIVLLYFSLCMAILLDNPFMLYYTFQCYYNTSLVMACGITSFRIWVTIKIFTTAVMAQVQLTAQTHLLYLLFDELPCISASRYWGEVTAFRILRCYKLAHDSDLNSEVLVAFFLFSLKLQQLKALCDGFRSLNSEISSRHYGFLWDFCWFYKLQQMFRKYERPLVYCTPFDTSP